MREKDRNDQNRGAIFGHFVFFPPTKLNRDERVTCSEARSIQPLCLGDVGIKFRTSPLRL